MPPGIGVRIRHESQRNVVATLVDPKRPYVSRFECPTCHRTHLFKTYHFRLDEAGSAIVSTEIVARLKTLDRNGGFAIGEEVKDPPKQSLRVGGVLVESPVPVVADPKLREPT